METRLPTAQEAAIGFARRLRAAGPGRGRRLRQPRRHPADRSRTTPSALEQAIRKTSAGGSTSLYNAIYIALEGSEEGRRHATSTRSAARRSSCCPTARTRRACCRSRRCSTSRSAPRPRSTRSACGPPRSSGGTRLQGGRVRAAAARAGDRRPGVLPQRRSTDLAGDLQPDLRRALEPVHRRLHVEERASATARGAASSSASSRPNAGRAHQAGLLRADRPAERLP